jgi:hypothetical protein
MKHKGLIWSNSLLDNGKSYTQPKWVSLLKDTEWRLPTVKEYESLHGCKGKFMDELREEFENHWLMTGDVLINPFNGEKRPVVLGLLGSNDRFGIDVYGYDDGPARGVKRK